jgi:hypothetical protein
MSGKCEIGGVGSRATKELQRVEGEKAAKGGVFGEIERPLPRLRKRRLEPDSFESDAIQSQVWHSIFSEDRFNRKSNFRRRSAARLCGITVPFLWKVRITKKVFIPPGGAIRCCIQVPPKKLP